MVPGWILQHVLQIQESGLFKTKSEEDLWEWYLDVYVAASCVVDNVEGSNGLRPRLFKRFGYFIWSFPI